MAVLRGQFLHFTERPVRRSVIHKDEFVAHAFDPGNIPAKLLVKKSQALFLVITGHNG